MSVHARVHERERKRERPDNVAAREETTAEEILTRLSNDMLKAMLVTIYNRGSNGAPSQPETSNNRSDEQQNNRLERRSEYGVVYTYYLFHVFNYQD